ncbi:MAG: M48 family metalloprotease [Candidatus Tumulicola sp.]
MLVRLGKMSPVTFHFFSRTVVAVFLAACLWPQAARSDTVTPQQRTWETQIGQQRFMQYEQRGEIVPQQSPLYQTLDPIGKAIASVADPQYFAPFHFVLLNQGTPNAVAMPGGNVYVATSMLSFLRNQDELAGVLCHEVNHDIHHDVFDIYQATQGGRTAHDPAAIGSERQAETNADRAGAYTCAKAGFNPWGMVWNLRLHGQALNGAQQASNADHPSDAQRTADLIALFQSDPATFAKYRDNVAMAKPLNVPAQVSRQYAYQQPQQYQQYPQQYRPQYPQQYGQYPQQYPQYPQQYPQYPQQYGQYPQQYPPQYPQQHPPQYPQQYGQYPQQYGQYPQQYPQYPQQYPPQYPQQQGPYPPPPLPPCYPGC